MDYRREPDICKPDWRRHGVGARLMFWLLTLLTTGLAGAAISVPGKPSSGSQDHSQQRPIRHDIR